MATKLYQVIKLKDPDHGSGDECSSSLPHKFAIWPLRLMEGLQLPSSIFYSNVY